MIPDPYTQLAHHLHALVMGYPLRDDLVDMLRAHLRPIEAEVARPLPNTHIPLELSTADEAAVNEATEGPLQAVCPYAVMEDVIRWARTIAVAHCPCRMTTQLLGKATLKVAYA